MTKEARGIAHRDRPLSHDARYRIGGERTGRAAIDVARKLVGQQQISQRSLGTLGPAFIDAGRRGQMRLLVTAADFLIDGPAGHRR